MHRMRLHIPKTIMASGVGVAGCMAACSYLAYDWVTSFDLLNKSI